MNQDIKKKMIKNKDENNEFKFIVKFNNNGESFQEIMERIIIAKLRDKNCFKFEAKEDNLDIQDEQERLKIIIQKIS